MGLEIERKFLVNNDAYKSSSGVHIQQGYLLGSEEMSIRIRIMEDAACLAIKGSTISATRQEFEYPIPITDAREMINDLCEEPLIDKHRYVVDYKGNTWDVDEFHGPNEGLVIAEIELESEDQSFEKPEWIGEEVTGDERYYNMNLVRNPYKDWK